MSYTSIIILGSFSIVAFFILCMSSIYFFGLYDVSLFTRADGLHNQENISHVEI